MKPVQDQSVWYLDAEQATFRSVIELNPDALRQNYLTLLEHTGRPVMPVLKSDAYGLGLPLVYHALRSLDPPWIGVANPWEGLRLRRLGFRGRILVLSGFLPDEAPLLIQWDLTPAVYQDEHLTWLRPHLGKSPFRIHFKIDTGMGRLGIPWDDLDPFITKLKKEPRLEVEGLFSNLACADIPEHPQNLRQIDCFEQARRYLHNQGIEPVLCHLANSAASHLIPKSWYDMIRPGLGLYGWKPESSSLTVQPVLRWWTRVMQVRKIPAGWSLGYGATFTLENPRWIAIIGLGYFDGFDRRFSNHAHVLGPRGQILPVLGRVSMDLTAVGLEDEHDLKVGDVVVILGPWQDRILDLENLARWADTTPHEILCRIGPRVSRRMVSNPSGFWPPWRKTHGQL